MSEQLQHKWTSPLCWCPTTPVLQPKSFPKLSLYIQFQKTASWPLVPVATSSSKTLCQRDQRNDEELEMPTAWMLWGKTVLEKTVRRWKPLFKVQFIEFWFAKAAVEFYFKYIVFTHRLSRYPLAAPFPCSWVTPKLQQSLEAGKDQAISLCATTQRNICAANMVPCPCPHSLKIK